MPPGADPPGMPLDAGDHLGVGQPLAASPPLLFALIAYSDWWIGSPLTSLLAATRASHIMTAAKVTPAVTAVLAQPL